MDTSSVFSTLIPDHAVGIKVPDGFTVLTLLFGGDKAYELFVELFVGGENHRLKLVTSLTAPIGKTALLNRRIALACAKERLGIPVKPYVYKPRKRRMP